MEQKQDLMKSEYCDIILFIRSKQKDYHENYMKLLLESSTKTSKVFASNQKAQQTKFEFLIDLESRSLPEWLVWIEMDEHEICFCKKYCAEKSKRVQKIC